MEAEKARARAKELRTEGGKEPKAKGGREKEGKAGIDWAVVERVVQRLRYPSRHQQQGCRRRCRHRRQEQKRRAPVGMKVKGVHP